MIIASHSRKTAHSTDESLDRDRDHKSQKKKKSEKPTEHEFYEKYRYYHIMGLTVSLRELKRKRICGTRNFTNSIEPHEIIFG